MGYLQELLRNRDEIDNLLLFSNSDVVPSALDEFLTEYRRVVNPHMLFVNVDLSGAKPSVQTNSTRHPSDVNIAGYSDAILRFVADRGEGVGLVTYVDRIDRAHALDEVDASAPPKRYKFNRRPRTKKGAANGAAASAVFGAGTFGFGKKTSGSNLHVGVAAPDVVVESIPPPLPVLRLQRCARVFISSTFRFVHFASYIYIVCCVFLCLCMFMSVSV